MCLSCRELSKKRKERSTINSGLQSIPDFKKEKGFELVQATPDFKRHVCHVVT